MSGNTGRDESGRFESDLSNAEIMDHFSDGRPFYTATEVAERFEIDRSTAYRRLSQLEDAGRLRKVPLGSRTVVWWYTADTAPASDTVEPDDPLFSAPSFSVDDPVDEEEIDKTLYGELE